MLYQNQVSRKSLHYKFKLQTKKYLCQNFEYKIFYIITRQSIALITENTKSVLGNCNI